MTEILIRGGTAAQWASVNSILADRELGVTSDTLVLKVGDGVTAWNSLPAIASGGGTITGLDGGTVT